MRSHFADTSKRFKEKKIKYKMKKGILLIGFISLLSKLSAQNCDTYKTQIASLQTENKVLISDNDYLKKLFCHTRAGGYPVLKK